jgi:ATP-dependent exoDNAse (exonuclease V) alpha subunit
VTVKRENGEQVSCDPRRLHGVTLYREAERAFSQGDRAQFTAPNRERHIANRELGTIEKIDDSGNLQLRLDSGPTVAFNIKENPHLDYGYAVTSHSSQGQTADCVLIHVDTEQAGEKLVNRRLAYVAVSRALTPEQRTEPARKAVRTRWAKAKKKRKRPTKTQVE